MNEIYDLREAAALIRKTPTCTTVHDRCECEFSDQIATWFERLAEDLPLALETAHKILASDRVPVDGSDWLDPDRKPLLTIDSEPVLKAVG